MKVILKNEELSDKWPITVGIKKVYNNSIYLIILVGNHNLREKCRLPQSPLTEK